MKRREQEFGLIINIDSPAAVYRREHWTIETQLEMDGGDKKRTNSEPVFDIIVQEAAETELFYFSPDNYCNLSDWLAEWLPACLP